MSTPDHPTHPSDDLSSTDPPADPSADQSTTGPASTDPASADPTAAGASSAGSSPAGASGSDPAEPVPVAVHVEPALEDRNRLTTAFRILLAIPHLLLVGGPAAAFLTWGWTAGSGWNPEGGGGGGVLGVVAAVVAMIAWFSILFTGRTPAGLRSLLIYYLRWRVRAVAYTALLRDEYPPFGEGAYPAQVEIEPVEGVRNRWTVGFRIILVIPHLLAVWVLGVGWAIATLLAWVMILLTGRHPPGLYRFGVGVLRWSTRMEAYLLLLHDEYPPFSLE